MTTPRVFALVTVLALVACSSAAPSGSSSSSSSSQPGATPSTGTSLFTSVAASPGAGSCVPAAPTTFANAICVCDDLAEAGVLHTHASAAGAANVGVDGRVGAATGTAIQGSLLAYGGLAVAGALGVRDAVASTGNVDGAGVLHVGGDLSVGGAFGFAGVLQVGGALRLAQPGIILPGAIVGSSAPYAAPAGPPCGCDPSMLLPIASAVAAAASSNDNAAVGLGTTGADLLGVGDLVLPSGRYYFKDVTRIGAGKIEIQGAVALYIDGSLDEVGADRISIDAGGSLDLYVSGALATAGAVILGDPTNPEAFRVFVGGAGAMVVTAGAQAWNGLIYAPQAHVAFAGVTVLNGALFAESLDWAGVLDVYYEGVSATAPCTPDTGDAPSSPPVASSPPAPVPK